LLLAGTLLYDEKIRQSAALFKFGLRDDRILQIFFSPAVIQRTIVAFLETGLAVKIAVCLNNKSAEEVGGLEVFLYETAQKFELSNIQDQK
jgi:hypothetical protein